MALVVVFVLVIVIGVGRCDLGCDGRGGRGRCLTADHDRPTRRDCVSDHVLRFHLIDVFTIETP